MLVYAYLDVDALVNMCNSESVEKTMESLAGPWTGEQPYVMCPYMHT